MRLAADLSHYIVDREMPCPPTAYLQGLIAKILERSDSFQGRVAARGQIQLPLNFPQNAKWVSLFRAWWREGFDSWHARHARDNLPPDIPLRTRSTRLRTHRRQRPRNSPIAGKKPLTLATWARELWKQAAADWSAQGIGSMACARA